MSFYRDKYKIIYRRYRMIRKFIWTTKFIEPISFRSDIMLLINLIASYTHMIYAANMWLVALNDYYENMCIDEMHERIKLEKSISDMHKRFKLGVNIKGVL